MVTLMETGSRTAKGRGGGHSYLMRAEFQFGRWKVMERGLWEGVNNRVNERVSLMMSL